MAHIQLHRTINRVTVDGEPVKMSNLEYRLLRCLMSQPGEVITRQDIFETVWPDFGPYPEPKILDVIVCTLRRKLAKMNARHGIETFRGVGYGFFPQPSNQEEPFNMGKTFHHQMMRKLDGATYQGRQIPPREHHAMRQALRKANMRGAAIMSDKELAKATLAELARSQ